MCNRVLITSHFTEVMHEVGKYALRNMKKIYIRNQNIYTEIYGIIIGYVFLLKNRIRDFTLKRGILRLIKLKP